MLTLVPTICEALFVIKCTPCAFIFNVLSFVIAGLLLAFFCVTKREKLEFEDVGDSGGILLKSNTESPGEEVVRT